MPKQEEKPDVEQNQQLTEFPGQEEVGASVEKESLWDKVTDLAHKGLESIKTGAGKVSQMADDATKLGKIKYELYSLKNERQNLAQQAGEKIWLLHKEKQPELADEQLADTYGQFTELAEKIEMLEAQFDAINLAE